MGKNSPAKQETQETQVRSLGQKDTLKKGGATHSSIPAWKIPWTEEPGRPESIGLQRVATIITYCNDGYSYTHHYLL